MPVVVKGVQVGPRPDQVLKDVHIVELHSQHNGCPVSLFGLQVEGRLYLHRKRDHTPIDHLLILILDLTQLKLRGTQY